MALPITRKNLLSTIAVETARMAYPGSMSRSKKPVVAAGTKATLEDYFRDHFPIESIWDDATKISRDYDNWHHARVSDIATHIRVHISSHNDPSSVAAKFLNTFMHQLMKYEAARPLFPFLHLPLDARVFTQLKRIASPSITPHKNIFSQSPYSVPYANHLVVQEALWQFIRELNARANVEFQLSSRIELNWLWL